MKLLLSITCLILMLSTHAQNSHYVSFDSENISSILNGKWKYNVEGKKGNYEFNFDSKSLVSEAKYINHWLENKCEVAYKLSITKDQRIYLTENFTGKGDDFTNVKPFEYVFEIWIIDSKTIAINYGDDFGKYILKKKGEI